MAKTKTAVTPTAGARLAGKIAVVTGAAGNLGGHIVRHYLAEGATVVMTGRTPARTDAAAEAIRAEMGVEADRLATVALDGGDPQSVREAIADIVKRFVTGAMSFGSISREAQVKVLAITTSSLASATVAGPRTSTTGRE
jgi:malonyl-CoA reductase/3-hydroxypropionate dehydrogenase (NADP+)